jgi:hypothetical protein
MTVNNSVDPAAWLAEQIQQGDPDLLRSMVKTMAETLMSAEADGMCGAEYGMRSEERTNRRNGYRSREWDTRAGVGLEFLTGELQGSHDPLVTWHTLPTFAMRKMIEWKVPVRPAEPEAYLHVWQVTAHMLGIKDEYVPATWDAAYAQSGQILPRDMGPTQERRPRVTGARAT